MIREVIAVIPARGGSKGIPRKNLRIFNGQPLIGHTIEIAKASSKVTRVVVTSDDIEILEVAERHGAIALERDPENASDLATLDPVIEEVVERLHLADAIIVTLQATCPLVQPSTIDRVVSEVEAHPYATGFTVVEQRHLTWAREDDELVPNYEARKNRQEITPIFAETGGVVACLGHKILKHHTRFCAPVRPVVVSERESIDIDTAQDWAKAESALHQKRIAVFITGNEEVGLGHLYRQLTLYDHLAKHEVCFFCREDDTLIHDILKSKFIHVKSYTSSQVEAELLAFAPDVIVNDLLDGWTDLKEAQRTAGAKVITFETEERDLGFEHDIINALYPMQAPGDKFGPDWFILRPEFLLAKPKAINDTVSEILVTFGGVDPSDQSFRLYNLLTGDDYRGINCRIVLGKGYQGALTQVLSTDRIEIIRDTTQISRYMLQADIAVTSKGRTIYELAKCGVPLLSISQNEREKRHDFGPVAFEDLGLHCEISNEEISAALNRLIYDTASRNRMAATNSAINYGGIRNIMSLIEE